MQVGNTQRVLLRIGVCAAIFLYTADVLRSAVSWLLFSLRSISASSLIQNHEVIANDSIWDRSVILAATANTLYCARVGYRCNATLTTERWRVWNSTSFPTASTLSMYFTELPSMSYSWGADFLTPFMLWKGATSSFKTVQMDIS